MSTTGEKKRIEWENSIKLKKIQEAVARKEREYVKELSSSLSGSYKRLVTDSYLSAFGYNYGDEINYDNFDRCFEFHTRTDKGQIIPEFKFKESAIEFKEDFVGRPEDFNKNSVKEFITGEEVVIGSIFSQNKFDTYEERASYEEGNSEAQRANIDSDNINLNNDGMFVSISSENRYGEFNKINKTRGFSTVASVRKSADEQIKKNWESQKKYIIKKMENGRK